MKVKLLDKSDFKVGNKLVKVKMRALYFIFAVLYISIADTLKLMTRKV